MFFVDMMNSHVTSGPPVLPFVSNERLRSPDVKSGSPVEIIPIKHRAKFILIHGVFAGLSTVLFSVGIILIKMPNSKAYQNHRNVQIGATVLFIVGVGLGFALSFRNIQVCFFSLVFFEEFRGERWLMRKEMENFTNMWFDSNSSSISLLPIRSWEYFSVSQSRLKSS